tara:strand:+ start:848 stop:1150 length:303 start_codon:yes stop_codon:yes gene_type:complete
MAEQDWNVVTLNKRTTKPKTANAKDQQVRQAQQKGGAVHTESKGVSNKQRKGIDNYSKIDQMEEAGHVEKVWNLHPWQISLKECHIEFILFHKRFNKMRI